MGPPRRHTEEEEEEEEEAPPSMCIYTHIHVPPEQREREKRKLTVCIHIHIHIRLCIYICTYIHICECAPRAGHVVVLGKVVEREGRDDGGEEPAVDGRCVYGCFLLLFVSVNVCMGLEKKGWVGWVSRKEPAVDGRWVLKGRGVARHMTCGVWGPSCVCHWILRLRLDIYILNTNTNILSPYLPMTMMVPSTAVMHWRYM